jgi:DMSO/TMAO reductase YedYZ molybdopterin-dependent catalytic subunit
MGMAKTFGADKLPEGVYMTVDVIQSPDTQRAERLPPGQQRTLSWPVRHSGDVPSFDPASWDLAIFPKPLVASVKRFTWAAFSTLPRIAVFADFHSDAGWSKLDNLWDGVATRELMKHVIVTGDPKFVMIHCEHGFTVNLSLDDFLAEDCLFAMRHDGADLAPEHGGPLRLVVPRLYAWKSAKWVRGIELMTEDRPGFREAEHGFNDRGDPWCEERLRVSSCSRSRPRG